MRADAGVCARSVRSSSRRSSCVVALKSLLRSIHHWHQQEAPSPPPVRACSASAKRSADAGAMTISVMLRRYAGSPTCRRRVRSRALRRAGRMVELPARGRRIRDVAQLGSALDWGSRGRRFKSCRPDGKALMRRCSHQGFVVSARCLWPRVASQYGEGADIFGRRAGGCCGGVNIVARCLACARTRRHICRSHAVRSNACRSTRPCLRAFPWRSAVDRSATTCRCCCSL